MLATLVRVSIRYRGLVAALALLVTAYGAAQLSRAGLDIFPEFSPKAVIVQTEAPGLSANAVEVRVSRVLENALTGLIGLDHVRSESIEGLSIVTAVFRDDTDIYRNRQFVAERLAVAAAGLPPTVATPVAVPLTSSSATVRTIGVRAGELDPMQLRDIVDAIIVPRLLSVPGVADVNVFGGAVRSLQVQLLPERLRAVALGVGDVTAALRGVTGVASLGFVEDDNQRFALSLSGLPQTPESFARIVIRDDERGVVMLGDVARIRFAGEPAFGAAQIGGKPAVVMMVIGQFGANTLTVSNLLKDVLDEFQHQLGQRGVELYPSLFVPANYIEASLENISEHIMFGGGFVLLILVIFLFDARAAFISAVAIPLSLLGAVIVLISAGINLNIMVLGGLAIALGEVVDDAIIDTENIYRRLRENQARAQPLPVTRVILDASLEVRGSVVYASFIVILVFVPLLTLTGVAGRLFAPLGVTYILAVLASLVVALTVTPALCALLLGSRSIRDRDPPLIGVIRPLYGSVVRAAAARPAIPMLLVLGASIGVVSVLPSFGAQFLPPLREGHYIVHTTALPGTSLAESIRVGSLLTEEFLAVPGVRSVSQWAGRAQRGADTYGSHYSEYEVALEPLDGAEQQRVLEALRAILAAYPGLLFEANTFLTERVDETISGYAAAVVVNVFGKDLDALDRKALEIARVLGSIDGAVDVRIRAVATAPQVQVVVDDARAAYAGARLPDIVDAVASAYAGAVVGQTIDGDRVANVTVILEPATRQDLASIAALPIRGAGDAMITLGDVADVEQVTGRYNVLRRAGQRIQAVTANVAHGDPAGVVAQLRRRVRAELDIPTDMHLEYAGAGIEQAQARNDLIGHSLFAAIGVFMLIYVAIGSLRNVLLVAVNLPFALVGGVLAVAFTQASLSIGSVVGFVTLFGITVRNSIMLVSHYRHLVTVEGESWNLATAVRGAQERFPSIVMTTLVTALAMLPIAIDSDNAGREIMGPMAAIVIGGLLSSAALNLLVMPSVMLHFGRFAAPAQE